MGQKIYEPGPVCSGCNVVNGQLQCQYGLCIWNGIKEIY